MEPASPIRAPLSPHNAHKQPLYPSSRPNAHAVAKEDHFNLECD
jgi:hypothetical protein